MSARTDPPVRIDPVLLDALRKMAERNSTGIAAQASRVLAAGFRALSEDGPGKELAAAHLAFDNAGIPAYADGKPLKAAARVRIMHERAEQAIIAAVVGDDEQEECTHSLGESCPACVKSTNPDEPLEF